MDELDALSDGLSADGSTLTADLRAVNDQMNAVVNLCLDIFVDMTVPTPRIFLMISPTRTSTP